MNTGHSLTSFRSASARQRGVALVVALMLLLVATLTGMAGIRQAAMQERMAGNLYDRTLAMQAAQAALAAAKAALDADHTLAGAVDCEPENVTTLCPLVPGAGDANWQNVGNNFLLNTTLPSAGTPQYFIQLVGHEKVPLRDQSGECMQYGSYGCSAESYAVYRITARSANPAASGQRAVVLLGSMARVAL